MSQLLKASNRSNLTNKYYCSGTSSTVTCNPKYAVAVSATAITYIAHDGFKYGSDVSYSNGTYTLTNTIAGYPDATHHYTCKTTGTTRSTVYYVYYYTRGTSGANKYFIELSDGKKIDEAIIAMLDDDGVNRYNSSIKGQIEAWYGQNMTDYTDLFEDAIYCNDRTRTNQSTSGLDPSGGLTTAMTFSDRNGNTTLKCSRQIDQFAVGNNKAKNKYPVGLATYAEMNLLDNDTARTTGVQYLTGSPNSLANNGPNESYITTSGTLSNTIVTTAYGTRPVVSLKSGVTYRSGTGSQTDPYIIDVYDRSGTALFDTGQNVNAKIKSLVAGSSKLYSDTDSTVQAIKRANDLPDGFTPSSDNTVSTSTSEKPIYIFYDSTTNTVYYYSEAETVYLNPDSSYLFGCFESLTNISGLSQLNTSKVKNMTYMFRNCISLADINALSNWNTSRVIKMMDLFYYCKSLTDIGALGNWDTSNVANMSNMFYNCRLLENIDGASSWDTSNATRMDHMFWYCVSLEDIDGASNWDTSNVTRMDYMFYYCSPLTDIDALSNWDTSNVTNMSNMFYYCSSLTDIDALSDWDTSSVTDMSYMFYHCSSLDNIDALSDWDTSSVTNMYYMFGYCSSLEDIDGASNWDTSSVSNVSYVFIGATKAAGTFPILGNPTTYDGAFINAATAADTRITVVYDCVITQNIDAIIATKSASSDVVKGSCTGGNKTVFDTGKNVNAKIKTLVAGSSQAYTATDSTVEAIKRASALPDGFTPSADNTISISGSEYPIYIFYDNTTHTVYYYSQAETVYLNPDSSYLFDVFASLTDTSGLSQVNTSKVKNMSYMFYSCSSLEDIDGLSNWDTSSVTNMTYMLSNCSSLTDIDALSNWDTSSTTNMSYMFRYSSSLVNINALSDWDTSSVTDISNIFAYCSSLANIDGASDWDTSNVTNMAYMFRECVALVDMDALLDWDISSVTDMSYMFYGCTSIDDIDALSNWDTSSVTNMSYMFRNCSALEDIDGASNWDTSNVTNVSNVFAYATKASGIFPILGNPTSYGSAFTNAATYTDALLTQIRVKYSCDVTTNIDAIVATKSSGSNVVKDSECANVIDNSYVTITNQIQGNMGNVRKYFSYTVEVRDANNVIDNDLSTSFTLKNDQSEILSIPEGYTVRVTQAEENAYTTTVNNTRSRVIAEEVVGDMTITYKNSYDLSVDTGVKTIIPPYIVLLLLSILTLLGIGYISKKLELD